jgi:Zn-dependent protease
MRLVVSVANAGPGELEAKILVTLMRMAEAGVVINLILAVFNMLPVPPLDGSKVLMGVLPMELAWRYASLERWGLLIVVLLVASGALSKVLFPLIINGYDLIMRLFGL